VLQGGRSSKVSCRGFLSKFKYLFTTVTLVLGLLKGQHETKAYFAVKNGGVRQSRAVIQAVLRYLIKNPDAKDTTEGVRRWWLPEGYRKQRQEELEETLQFLVSKNWLTIRMTPQQEKLYGLNKNHLQEIVDFLRQDKRDSEP
jgi:hypothetical protein